MFEIWGPGVDAELAYRREALTTKGGTARATARQARPMPARPAATAAAHGHRGEVLHARRWSLRGSRVWHVAP